MKSFSPRLTLLVMLVGTHLAGCTTAPPNTQGAATGPSKSASKPGTHSVGGAPVLPPYKGGGYYKDDGPGLNPPDDLDTVPDAVPQNEPLHAFANNPYKVLGKNYRPLTSNLGYKQDGLASWYGRRFHGKPTSSGEPYDMYAMTAAHPTLPIPSYARVTHSQTGKSIVVRINDRGPFHGNRLIDLSYTAAHKLGVLKGVTAVTVEAVFPESEAASQLAQSDPEVQPGPGDVAQTAADPMQVAAVETSPSSPLETANSGVAYYLQLGAFSSQERANAILERATVRLSRSFPAVLRIAVDGLYKVQAGPFANHEEADQAAAQLRDEMGLHSFKVVSDTRALSNLTGKLLQASQAVSASQTGGLYLQLAAVSTSAAAETLGDRVRARYGAELPGLTQVQSGSLHKLQAGPFASAEAAERLSLAYQQDFGIKPHPVGR